MLSGNQTLDPKLIAHYAQTNITIEFGIRKVEAQTLPPISFPFLSADSAAWVHLL